ncbi:MAG: glycosyltransferase family 2 protein [Kangiellaceae bacterium]|nr:glycosyltransferase family 2 protein [Kangiellaceae bacterium]
MSTNESKVAIILVNYNQDVYTIKSIQSILKSEYSNYQVYLIDNGSEKSVIDRVVSELKDCEKLTIESLNENLGYVGGINYGLSLASKTLPKHFLILNNDTLIDPLSIKSLVDTCESHQCKAIVSGKVYNYDSKDSLQYIGQREDPEHGINQISIIKSRDEKDVGQYDSEMEMGMLDDIFWLFPAKLYQENGGYSDYFFLYGEQNDYAHRAKKLGYKLIYTPDAKLWHKGGVSTCAGNKKSARIDYWTSVATLKLAVLHLEPNRAKSFCRVWPLRKLVKTILLFFAGRASFDNVKAVYLANRHFKFWNLIRYKDNGYNPFR